MGVSFEEAFVVVLFDLVGVLVWEFRDDGVDEFE